MILPRYAPLELFDGLLAENGAVLYYPASQLVKLLADSPPAAFIEGLRDRIGDGSKIFRKGTAGEFGQLIQTGAVEAFVVGQVVVAKWQPYEREAHQLIAEMRLDIQIILNKRAVMVLPA